MEDIGIEAGDICTEDFRGGVCLMRLIKSVVSFRYESTFVSKGLIKWSTSLDIFLVDSYFYGTWATYKTAVFVDHSHIDICEFYQ